MVKATALALLVTFVSAPLVTAAAGEHPDKKHGNVPVLNAPELDPTSALAGLTLLAGGIAVMLGRRSKRLPTQAE